MSSSSKHRQTMAKLTRERAVKERRALKQEKREEKKQAAAALKAQASESTVSVPQIDDARHELQAGAPDNREEEDRSAAQNA